MDFDLDIDIEYSHSVEKCDLKHSHELAFDYAKSIGYNVQSYHYSPNQFDEFTKGDIGFHFARDRKVTYLRKDDIDGQDGQVFNVALKLNKPFNIKYDLQQWTAFEFFVNAVNKELGVNVYQHEDYSYRTQLAIGGKCRKFLTSIGYKVDEIIEIAWELVKTENALYNPIDKKYRDDIISHMDASGYDGLTYINKFEVDEDTDGLCYIVIHPNQIKSLDPQYDGDGLIPLTKRFKQSDNRFTR